MAGSHMRSAFLLKQNLIAVGMLWKYRFYDQSREKHRTLQVNFLEDIVLEVEIKIHDIDSVKVRAYVLKPGTFNTETICFLTTDVEGNDFLSKTITDCLYDANERIKKWEAPSKNWIEKVAS